MSTWLQRLKKLLAAPPKGSAPAAAETPFQQRARELLQSESGAQTLKDLLLANKPELGTASAQRRKAWQQQLDAVQAVLHAFEGERSIESAKAARATAHAELHEAERVLRQDVATLQADRLKAAAELARLQARLADLERVAAESLQLLQREHDARVTELQQQLAAAMAADDAQAAEAASTALSAELRQEAERRDAEARAPHPAALQASVLRGSCANQAAELEATATALRNAEAALARVRLEQATVDYHEGLAACILATAQARAEVLRWRASPEHIQAEALGRLDRLELDLVVSRPDLVPMGQRMREYRQNVSVWPVEERFLDAYLVPLHGAVDLAIFDRDTTVEWPDELGLQRQIEAEAAAQAAVHARALQERVLEAAQR
jgi:hypothetical protein